ncbi:MAG: c-type cytochrome [Burkholderiales bacterium]
MRSISSAVIFLAVAGVVLLAYQPSSETANAQEVPAQKKEGTVYTVQDGNKVDAKTLEGWRTWRAMACDRCHGANQEGMTGPPLIDSLKHMTMEEFNKAVLEGRPEKGMPNYNTTKLVIDNIDNLYAFLKGRSDDAIQPGRLQPITP